MPPSQPPTPAPTLVSKSAPSTTHLDPGATLANRYRIITHLGKGGMGEVYRADDLTLGVSVALKFLPPSLAQDPLRLEHFRSEVRLARQVSHPSVCRVYDIGESDSSGGDANRRIFISMEYVDGEDLASLLRRIGRLPSDKAIQIARQLCFGLAAAHEQGIIHRDLKPANIMLDGRGQSRIMDFGIAGLSSDLTPKEGKSSAIAGTPGYMSPEQLSGNEVTKRSDIYSLGVVLYELFTGRPAFTTTAIEELRSLQQQSSSVTRPSTIISDLDPAIERIIFLCLEPDPSDRPASAIAVAAALPGGDPLAAALAAGETPSPELIAAAGGGGAPVLTPNQAWARVGIIAAMILASIGITASWSMIARIKPEKSPEVLRDHAAEITRKLGYADQPFDTASGLSRRVPFISMINLNGEITNKVERFSNRPGPYEFWYRQSRDTISSTERDGSVGLFSPYPSAPGEICYRSDTSGNLELFAAIPSRRRESGPTEISPGTITELFRWAGFDPDQFKPAEPIFRPFVPVDTLKSWTGLLRSTTDPYDLPVRIHLGATEGRVTYFTVQYPWSIQALEAPPRKPQPWSAYDYASAAIVGLIILGTCRLAIRSIRSGRGDRSGALRLALAMFIFASIGALATQHHLPMLRSIIYEGRGILYPVFAAIELWLFYTALEPYARKIHPHALVSWTRLLRGQFKDPIVARHILLGFLVGAGCALFTASFAAIFRHIATPSLYVAPYGRTPAFLSGFPGVTSAVSEAFITALILGVGSMLPLVGGQLVFKVRAAGYLALGLMIAALELPTLQSNPLDGAFSIFIAMLPIGVIPRGGLLALVAAHLSRYLAQMLLVGFDWTHWFIQPVFIPAAILAALLFFTAQAASSARPASTSA